MCMKKVSYNADVVHTLSVTDETARKLWHKFKENHPELKEGKEFMAKSIHLTLNDNETEMFTDSINYQWGDSGGSGRVFEFADIAYHMFKNYEDFVLTNRNSNDYEPEILEIDVDALTPEDIDDFIIDYLDRKL